MVLDHACDIQVFCYDETISIYEFTGGLMMKVKTLIMDLLMKLSKRHSEFLLGGLQVLKIYYRLTRRKNSEIMYANIYADGLVRY